MEERLMNLEPCAARTAGVPHNPPLDRQASWHQCLTECQRVHDLVAMECAKPSPPPRSSHRNRSWHAFATAAFTDLLSCDPMWVAEARDEPTSSGIRQSDKCTQGEEVGLPSPAEDPWPRSAAFTERSGIASYKQLQLHYCSRR